MSIRVYTRKSFEVTLVPGATNMIMLLIDWLDENGQVTGPVEGADYERFYAQATEVPTAATPRPDPLMYFSVVHIPGYPDDTGTPHDGAFLLQMDPDDSLQLQTDWIQHGILDLFGVKVGGERDYLASGNFTTSMTATRVFA